MGLFFGFAIGAPGAVDVKKIASGHGQHRRLGGSGQQKIAVIKPGGDRGPGNRPGAGDRPGGGDRPNIGDRPGGGDRPGAGNRPGGGDRPGAGKARAVGWIWFWLVLLPEIALTEPFLERFEKRFGCVPVNWHSGLRQSEQKHTQQPEVPSWASHSRVGSAAGACSGMDPL